MYTFYYYFLDVWKSQKSQTKYPSYILFYVKFYDRDVGMIRKSIYSYPKWLNQRDLIKIITWRFGKISHLRNKTPNEHSLLIRI